MSRTRHQIPRTKVRMFAHVQYRRLEWAALEALEGYPTRHIGRLSNTRVRIPDTKLDKIPASAGEYHNK